MVNGLFSGLLTLDLLSFVYTILDVYVLGFTLETAGRSLITM